MNRKLFIAAFAALGLSLSGCDAVKNMLKKKSGDEAPAASASAAPPPATTVAEEKAPEPVLSDVPTTEDFEEDAFEQVTPANYEAELDKLEKEITKDAAPVKAATP